MKKFFVLMAVIGFVFVGCAHYGVWSPKAQQKLGDFGKYADQWVGGVLKDAPAIIAAVEMFAGSSKETVAAAQAVQFAQGALGAYHAFEAIGSPKVIEKEKGLLAAIKDVNTAIGAVKEIQKTIKAVPTK